MDTSSMAPPSYTEDKLWYKALGTKQTIAHLIDFETEILTLNKKVRTALRLYVLAKTKHGVLRRYTFLHRFDPYFIVVLRKPKKKEGETLKELRLQFVQMVDTVNKRPQVGKYTQGGHILRVEPYNASIFNNHKHPFYSIHDVAYKVFVQTPNDVKPYSRALLQHRTIVKDVREYDIDYHHRAAIDLKYHVGKRYFFTVKQHFVSHHKEIEIKKLPQLPRFIFDIEIRKQPMMFPKNEDPIDLIAVQYDDGRTGKNAVLFNNMELTHFEFPSFFVGVIDQELQTVNAKEIQQVAKLFKHSTREVVKVKVVNVADEYALLKEFQRLFLKVKPLYFAGFNSDSFDWPHIIWRSGIYGISWDMFEYDDYQEKYNMRGVIFGDVFHWVKTKAYLSEGLNGLKNAAKYKLNIQAMETEHEQQVKEWQLIKDVLLAPDKYLEEHPNMTREDLKTLITRELEESDVDLSTFGDITQPENAKRFAYQMAERFAHYCSSDTYITDVFAEQIVINFNLGLLSLTTFTGYEIERKRTGRIVDSVLLNRMNGKYVAPKRARYTSVPHFYQLQKDTATFCKDKNIDGEQETVQARLIERSEINEHCQKCRERDCKANVSNIWEQPCQTWQMVHCQRDSDPQNPHDQTFIYPYKWGQLAFISKVSYEGAYTNCYVPGIFRDDIPYEIKIDPSNLEQIRHDFITAIECWADQQTTRIIKGQTIPIKVHTRELIQQFEKLFDQFLSEIKNGKWKGKMWILHVDVASMYPSIIIHYNLQPYSTVSPNICKKCPYKYSEGEEPPCWVEIEWTKVVTVENIAESLIPKMLKEYRAIRKNKRINRVKALKELVSKYKVETKANKSKRKTKQIKYHIAEKSRFCQKADNFFSKSVFDFRTQRYHHKYKAIELKMANIDNDPNITQEVLYHNSVEKGLKTSLNTFYGYGFGPGSRFLSIDLVGAITSVGKNIIQLSIDYLNQFSKVIEVDTDGNWVLLPKIFPAFMKYQYSYRDPLTDKMVTKTDKCDTIIETLNNIIAERFTNHNNYIPCSSDGVIYANNGEEWNPKSNQSLWENQPKEYQRDSEWWKQPRWKNHPQNFILFDLDPPFKCVYAYTKKRMKIFSHKLDKHGKLRVDVVTGLDEIRNGELGIAKSISKNVTEIMANSKQTTLEGLYQDAINWYNTAIYNPLSEQRFTEEFPLEMITESSGISETTVEKVIDAYENYVNFIKDYPDLTELPISKQVLEYFLQQLNQYPHLRKHKQAVEKQFLKHVLKPISSQTYTMCAFRTQMVDGIEIDKDMNVEWIISKYPLIRDHKGEARKSTSTSECVLPTIIFNGTDDEIRQYLTQWFGLGNNRYNTVKNDLTETRKDEKMSVQIEDYVDWDYYLERANKKIIRYLVKPAYSQGIDCYKLGLKAHKKKHIVKKKTPKSFSLLKMAEKVKG